MNQGLKEIQELETIAHGLYERIENPTKEDWIKSYNTLKDLCELVPDEGIYDEETETHQFSLMLKTLIELCYNFAVRR